MDEKAIAAALGEGWSCRPQPGWQDRFYLSGPGGILLHIRKEGQRVQVTGSIPYDPRLARRWRESKITVAATRSADEVAKEIRRRLLPQLREQMAEWTSARDREDEWDSERDRVADDLIARLPHAVRREPHGHRREVTLVSHLHSHALEGLMEARIDGAHSIEFKLSWIPKDLAMAIADLLGSWARGGAPDSPEGVSGDRRRPPTEPCR